MTGQYLINQQLRALAHIEKGEPGLAEELLQQALRYPENLGEGRLVGQSDNDIWYLLGRCAQQQQRADAAKACYREALKGGSTLEAGRYYNDQPVDYLFYQAMAQKQLGEPEAAQQKFSVFIEWARQHRDDAVEPDFFAVSLPDLIALDGNPRRAHLQHCLFVEVLGHLGLGDTLAFNRLTDELLALNPAHDKAHLLRQALSIGML